MTSRQAFNFYREPQDEVYHALIDLGTQRCPTVLLVVRDLAMLTNDGRRVLERLKEYLVDEREDSEWPGTVLHGGKAIVYSYQVTPGLSDCLKTVAAGLYAWQHPHLPEDLCFIRSDKTPWLVSIVHESDAYLNATEDEMHQILNLEPILEECLLVR